jgi:hypothetical protein
LCGFAGGDCDTTSNDQIAATFNMDFGNADVLGGEKFYLGFDPDLKPSGDVDFISVAMHEITHGLGFLGLVNIDTDEGPLGAKAGLTYKRNSSGDPISAFLSYGGTPDYGPFDDIYDAYIAMVDGSTYTPFTGYEVNGANDAARAAAMVSGPVVRSAGSYSPGNYTGIRWSDAAAAGSSENIHATETAPNNFPSLYAPCDKTATTDCATQPGSTLSHTVQAGDMMNAYYTEGDLRSMGLAVPMLGAIGWSNATASTPIWGEPIPSNWYDRTHSGHGFDFQLAYRDAVNGDVYFLTFYTYAADGTPEWYNAFGHLVDGVFLPTTQDSNGSTMVRIRYSSNALGQLNAVADGVTQGSVIVDFNQAAQSPVCRNADRSAVSSVLAVMYWNIGNDSASWCMEPATVVSQHASPDYNGHWYAPSDSGWGFELLDLDAGAGAPATAIVYLYYPGPNNKPTWALASGSLSAKGTTGEMPLQVVSNGFCRTCAPPTSLTTTTIGTLSLNMDPIVAGEQPKGKATINITAANAGTFDRVDVPIVMLSAPTGN